MEQRQLRLGDILDDYCPRERRVTNHAVVAMVGADVKQTRCTTCDAEHEFKHAKVPRQRKKAETPAALFAQVAAGAPKRVVHGQPGSASDATAEPEPVAASDERVALEDERDGVRSSAARDTGADDPEQNGEPGDGAEEEPEEAAPEEDEGPVHRPLIRAALPRPEGQPPPQRPLPEFTIRQPGGRQNRFRPRGLHGGSGTFQGNRSNGNAGGQGGPMRSGGGMRQGGGGRPQQGGGPSRFSRRDGQGRKRSK